MFTWVTTQVFYDLETHRSRKSKVFVYYIHIAIKNIIIVINFEDQQFYKTRRVIDAEKIINKVCKNFAEILSKTSSVEIHVPEPVSNSSLEDSSILRELITNLQKKFNSAKTVYDKIEHLTLLPIDWDRKKIRQYFDCNDYIYMKLSQFKQMNGKLINFLYNQKVHSRHFDAYPPEL